MIFAVYCSFQLQNNGINYPDFKLTNCEKYIIISIWNNTERKTEYEKEELQNQTGRDGR